MGGRAALVRNRTKKCREKGKYKSADCPSLFRFPSWPLGRPLRSSEVSPIAVTPQGTSCYPVTCLERESLLCYSCVR